VISEHVNGILKGQWTWLTSIPNKLDGDPKSMKEIMKLIDICIILHNFLVKHNYTEDEK